jgi:hypothetical protein
MNRIFLRTASAVVMSHLVLVAPSFAGGACTVASAANVPVVVELYTSEGCDSCPPADRWLSKTIAERSADASFIALAYHVDYWDYIGWKDPFAQAVFTQRQSALAAAGGASGVYTPQFFVNGRDDRSWTRGAARPAASTAATVKFTVSSTWRADGAAPSLAVSGKLLDTLPGVRLRYAVTENDLTSAVKAGENRGVTLRHDAVVRASGGFALNLSLPRTLVRAKSQLHVIAEDTRGAPLAAAIVACPA